MILEVFQRMKHEESEVELDEEVDILMSSDIISVQLSTKSITFEKTISGWLFKHEKLVNLFMFQSFNLLRFLLTFLLKRAK